ncbi:MAG: ABC transporter permease subunit [Campylobacteraceae bacterium]|jgi:NitT/TauT family transport system permease protein|nr:ABC transporter permease subunit [Campylobacteraceae bacterium]
MSKTKKTVSIGDLRDRYEKELKSSQFQTAKIELSIFERIFDIGAVRKTLIIITLALIWQLYAVYLDNDLMLPTFLVTLEGFWSVISSGELVEKIVTSLRILFTAYLCGVLLAGTLTVLAITTRIGTDFLEVLTAMFNPLPAIALLPLALLWFGLGYPSIIFVIIHAVTWPIALNIYNGFMGVSGTLRMVGRNYELKGLGFVFKILIPAAFASILTGLKVGWAFSWRTLIAAELVFGVSSGGGGLGWFIYEKKNQLDIDLVFAGLLSVIIIGILIENIVFKSIEKKTVIKWGMKF